MIFPLEIRDRYTLITTSGDYTTEAVLEMITKIPAHSPRGYPLLVDGRLSQHNPNVFELKQIAQVVLATGEHFGRRAALVVKPGLRYGIARMLQAFGDSEEFEFRVFVDLAEAETWLSRRDQSGA